MEYWEVKDWNDGMLEDWVTARYKKNKKKRKEYLLF